MENLNSTFKKKIGNTIFIVSVKSSENSKKSLEKLYRDMCIHDVLSDNFFSEYVDSKE